jgi:hypothetical protein
MCIYIYICIHMLRTSEIGHSEDLSPNSSVGSIHTNVYIYMYYIYHCSCKEEMTFVLGSLKFKRGPSFTKIKV